MKKLFIITLAVCTLALTGLTVQAKSSGAANIQYDSFSNVQADINKRRARSVKKNTRYSIECPRCKVKNYYRQGQLRGNKITCTNCGHSFRPGIITNRGHRLKPLRKSNFGGAYYNKK